MAIVDVNGTSVEMTEEDALDVISEIIQTFDFIGSVMSRKDVEDAIERPVSSEEWLRLADDFADDVYRFVMDIPVAAS